MLGVDVDKAFAQLSQYAQLHGHIANEGSTFARGRDYAADGNLLLPLQVVLFEPLFEGVAVNFKHTLHRTTATRIALHTALTLATQQQTQRTKQNGFTRTSLTRDDIQTTVEIDFEALDEGVIFDL